MAYPAFSSRLHVTGHFLQRRRDLQQRLVKEGYGMRVYIPFGTEWYPYFMRRLAERPANAMFVLKNLLK